MYCHPAAKKSKIEGVQDLGASRLMTEAQSASESTVSNFIHLPHGGKFQ
jgi:hypothetical protein